jgi:hypothetical protein
MDYCLRSQVLGHASLRLVFVVQDQNQARHLRTASPVRRLSDRCLVLMGNNQTSSYVGITLHNTKELITRRGQPLHCSLPAALCSLLGRLGLCGDSTGIHVMMDNIRVSRKMSASSLGFSTPSQTPKNSITITQPLPLQELN